MTLLTRMEWYSAINPDIPVGGLSPFRDLTGITARKGLDLKNNICEFELKNPNGRYVSGGNIRFLENDMIKLFLKFTDDATDITGEWWGDDSLVSYYYVEEYEQRSSLDKHRIKLSAVDRAFILFNKVFANSYGAESDAYWTSPGIFRSVVRINASRQGGIYTGTQNNPGIELDIEANFLSEGGKITDFRAGVSTTLSSSINASDTTISLASTAGFPDADGTIVMGGEHIYYQSKTGNTLNNCVRAIDDTVALSHTAGATVYLGFPIVDLSLIWKPLYEWLGELGQTQRTNYSDELVNETLFYDRAFILWIDKDNKINWIPATDDVNLNLNINSSEIYEMSLQKSVFDAVNMVIYNVGEDMYGAGKTWYFYDINSDVSTLKMRYQPMIDIIPTIYSEEVKAYPARYDAATANAPKRFPNAYPVNDWKFKQDTNNWRVIVLGQSARTSIANDGEYNKALEEAAFWRGRVKSQALTQKLAGLRYRGNITLPGTVVNPGDLLRVTDGQTGVNNQLIRVVNVTHNVGKNQWSTTLEVEEDEKTITT